MGDNIRTWQAKLLAWVHDPAEKALVLMSGKGHEKGTVEALKRTLFPHVIPRDLAVAVKKADIWAAAADRLAFPRATPFQVSFHKAPVLVHPLSGDQLNIREFFDIHPEHMEAVSFDHFSSFIVKQGDQVDWRKTFLSFWRFGPESPAKELGHLWNLLPADTRVPDHTIWTHLDLTSAFAGAFVEDTDHTPALLIVSMGPVQGFINQARSTSDLWASSHLLSHLCWIAIKVLLSLIHI